jgi:hypothetical protein
MLSLHEASHCQSNSRKAYRRCGEHLINIKRDGEDWAVDGNVFGDAIGSTPAEGVATFWIDLS